MASKPDLSKILRAALELQEFCQSRKWRFCFIGGLAYQPWGDPRATLDADITLLTGFGNEESYVDTLLARFPPRRNDAREFALRNRVLLLWSSDGIGIDIGLGALPFEERSIERSSHRKIAPGCSLRVCSAEDLIVHKAFASREQDWIDVDKILMRQGKKLDTGQIFEELRPLVALKEDDTILPRLEQRMRKRGVLDE